MDFKWGHWNAKKRSFKTTGHYDGIVKVLIQGLESIKKDKVR